MTDRPYNIRPNRVLEQSYTDGRNARRLLNELRTDDDRVTNRPYRGIHRAEHTNHDDYAAEQRRSRVGRHHADPSDDHHVNHR
ncbi:hypothetical protein [Actinoplanes sp. NPDC051851]|uniref:hypothetical protein n=1 Tax=Actinoplanes sp. NPDC051851 TaxID=3154753 RepID=UPI003448AF7B